MTIPNLQFGGPRIGQLAPQDFSYLEGLGAAIGQITHPGAERQEAVLDKMALDPEFAQQMKAMQLIQQGRVQQALSRGKAKRATDEDLAIIANARESMAFTIPGTNLSPEESNVIMAGIEALPETVQSVAETLTGLPEARVAFARGELYNKALELGIDQDRLERLVDLDAGTAIAELEMLKVWMEEGETRDAVEGLIERKKILERVREAGDTNFEFVILEDMLGRPGAVEFISNRESISARLAEAQLDAASELRGQDLEDFFAFQPELREAQDRFFASADEEDEARTNAALVDLKNMLDQYRERFPGLISIEPELVDELIGFGVQVTPLAPVPIEDAQLQSMVEQASVIFHESAGDEFEDLWDGFVGTEAGGTIKEKFSPAEFQRLRVNARQIHSEARMGELVSQVEVLEDYQTRLREAATSRELSREDARRAANLLPEIARLLNFAQAGVRVIKETGVLDQFTADLREIQELVNKLPGS